MPFYETLQEFIYIQFFLRMLAFDIALSLCKNTYNKWYHFDINEILQVPFKGIYCGVLYQTTVNMPSIIFLRGSGGMPPQRNLASRSILRATTAQFQYLTVLLEYYDILQTSFGVSVPLAPLRLQHLCFYKN